MEMGSGVTEYHVHVDDDTFLCCPIPDGASLAGVVMTHRLERLHELSMKNFHLAIMCLIYIAINMVCFTMNFLGEKWLAVDSRELTFHLIEFWATFAFSCVQVYSLVFSPRSLGAMYRNPLVLKTVIFLNVASTFFSALLVTVSLETFECLSHEIEYTNEITMAFVDVILLGVVARQAGYNIDGVKFSLLATLVTLVVAVLQLGIYNSLDGPHGGPGEPIAHYFEFAFESISALISFSFCMDSKLLCDRALRMLLDTQQKNRVSVGAVCSQTCTHAAKSGRSLVSA